MKTFLAVAAGFSLAVSALAQQSDRHKGPLVRIQGNGNVTVTAAVGTVSTSKHDQTIEMAQQMLKHCPEITLTIGEDQKPDYDLLLNREGVGLFNEGDSQYMLVRSSDKMVLYANKKGTVAKAVKDACRAILVDSKQQHPPPASAGDWSNSPTRKP